MTALLDEPNNILGIEYLKAIRKLKSTIKPYTILRKGARYHDQELSTENLSSASAIRSLLSYSGSSLRKYDDLPKGAFDDTAPFNIFGELESQVPQVLPETFKRLPQSFLPDLSKRLFSYPEIQIIKQISRKPASIHGCL